MFPQPPDRLTSQSFCSPHTTYSNMSMGILLSGLILFIYDIQPLAARASQRPNGALQPKQNWQQGNSMYGSITTTTTIDLSPRAWMPQSQPGPIDEPISRISNRDQIPELLEEEGATRGAEIGVNVAHYARRVLSLWDKCQKYILIDAWQHLDNYHDIANIDARGHNKRYAISGFHHPFPRAWPPAAYFRMTIIHGRPTGIG